MWDGSPPTGLFPAENRRGRSSTVSKAAPEKVSTVFQITDPRPFTPVGEEYTS